MNLNDKIYIAGHSGLVGSALVRQLQDKGYNNILMRSHKELDLINQLQVQKFFEQEKRQIQHRMRLKSWILVRKR